jgi:drug/metabolite transporter (DMT)-like permease
MSTRQLLPLIGALFALYIIWGSTYFAIAVGVASWPPLMMAGIRFLSAGVLLLGWLLATGHKLPARRPLLNAALIGVCCLPSATASSPWPNISTFPPGSRR